MLVCDWIKYSPFILILDQSYKNSVDNRKCKVVIWLQKCILHTFIAWYLNFTMILQSYLHTNLNYRTNIYLWCTCVPLGNSLIFSPRFVTRSQRLVLIPSRGELKDRYLKKKTKIKKNGQMVVNLVAMHCQVWYLNPLQ